MKNIFSVLLLVVLLISCSSEDQFNTIESSNELSSLTIKDLMPHFPNDKLSNSSRVSYRSANGAIKFMEIEQKREIVKKRLTPDITYDAEEIVFSLFEENTNEYALNIFVGANYFAENNDAFTKYIKANLTTSYNNGLIAKIGMVLENQSITSIRKFDKIEFNDKMFYEVHASIDYPVDMSGYSQIYFNKTHGVVAFSDRDDTLWVIDDYHN